VKVADNSVKKITIYKVPDSTFDCFKHDDYDLVGSGSETLDKTKADFKLFYGYFEQKDPGWIGLFSGMDLNVSNDSIPQVQQAGFILLVKIESNCYAVTGGMGHIHLKTKVDVEADFGIELAESILMSNEIRGLAQRETGSKVFAVDRHFGSVYDPVEDTANLKRILKRLRGTMDENNPLFSEIGNGIVASDALSVVGEKTFSKLIEFLVKVHDLHKQGKKSVRIPRLRQLGKQDQALIDELDKELVKKLCSSDGYKDFHLDVFEVPVDSVSEYRIRARSRIIETTYQGLMRKLGDRLKKLTTLDKRVEQLKSYRLQYWVEDVEYDTVPFFGILCGDVVFNGDPFYLFAGRWYRADKEYIKLLNSELDQLRYYRADELQLKEWPVADPDSTGVDEGEGEGIFNDSHAGSHVVLDRRTITVSGHRGPIEFCDLLLDASSGTFLIHVKKAHGAKLRELFSQGYVSAQLYASVSDFQKKIHTGNVANRKPALTKKEEATLAGLKKKPRGALSVIYAIYDDEKASATTSEGKTMEALGGTLTTFAKVDLLGRIAMIRELGYNVGITRIKPFPAKAVKRTSKKATSTSTKKAKAKKTGKRP
jgi:uncharacterized protein (TIGR04141 family)